MNERIRELAKQADPDYTVIYDDDMGHALVGGEAIQKFAELIVQECMNAVYSVDDLGGYHYEAAKAIKDHFDVA
jgi:hypothetical protein